MDGGYPENAIRYFAVLGADASGIANPANPLPVSVLQRYPLEDHKDCRFPPALASFCFPRGGAQCISSEEEVPDALHGFVLTNEAGDRCFGAALHIWCLHPSGSLVQKALAVVSTQPLWGAFRAFLCSLRASSCPERFIVNFVAETPLPPPGFVVTVALPGFPELALYRPAPNQLPLLDLPVKRMIQQLKPEIVVSLVEALLVEQRIVLHSTCISVVCAFCEILVGLIWPLRPAAVYVPLLPDALVDFCGAPLPFVLGIASEMVKRAEAICEPHTLFVNVDTCEVKVTQENSLSISLGMSSSMQGPRPSPPERPHKKLLRRIDLALRGLDFQAEEQKHRFPLPLSRPTTSTPKQRNSSYGLAPAPGSSPATRPRIMSGTSDVTEVDPGPDVSRVSSGALSAKRHTSTDEAHSLDHILARQGDAAEFDSDALIRMAFLWFMTDLLVDHSRFAHERFDGGFDQSGFLSRCSETERPFLKEVTSTQMWASWIGRRINRSKEDSTDVILFDEVIAQKLNRKTFMFNKTATPFLSLDFSARMQESGHYRVAEPPVNEAVEELSYYSAGTDWHCDESRFYTPRPLPNLQAMLPSMSVPVRKEVERETMGAKDPLHPSHMAPLVWYLQHCWLMTWAAYLPDRPENKLLQWAKMDLCLAMLHKTGEDHREMPAPHDLALSLLAAACARCGALRVDLARRLFAWMKVKQLGVATHPQSTSVFFERFIQLCASDHGCNGRQVQDAFPNRGNEEAPVAHRNAQGAFGSPTEQADVLLMEDLASRPPVALQVADGAPKATLVFGGQCSRCQGKLTLLEIFSQWSRPGTEETSAVQCPHCRYTGTVQLQITTDKSPVEVDLLHPKRLALALRGHLDARGHGNEALGPTWLSGLSSAPILWTNLVWYFRSHSFFTEHLLTALAPEKVQNVVEKIVVTLQGRERRVEDGTTAASTELLAPREGPTNSWAAVHSRNHSYGGTSIGTEVWDDVELDLPMESPQLAAATAISCAHTLVRRRSRTSLGESSVESRRRSKEVQVDVEIATGPELFFEMSQVEILQMEKEDLLSQLWRSELCRRHEEAAGLARAVLSQVYKKVSKPMQSESMEANAMDLARLVADAAVAKSMVKSMSRMLANTMVPEAEKTAVTTAEAPAVVVLPSVPVDRQGVQVPPATIITDDDPVSVGSFPCSPAMPLPSSVTGSASHVSSEGKKDSPSHQDVQDVGRPEVSEVPSAPSMDTSVSVTPIAETEVTGHPPSPNIVRKAGFGAHARPNGTTSVNGSSRYDETVETPTKLKTLEDFLQEADEELKVQQSLRSQETTGTASEVVLKEPMKDPLDVALATTSVTIPDHDVEGVVEKVELNVQQSLPTQEDTGTASEVVLKEPMKDPLDVALATTLVTIPDHDVEGVVEKVKLNVQQSLRNQETTGTASEVVLKEPMKDPLDVALATTLVTIPDHNVEGVVEKVELNVQQSLPTQEDTGTASEAVLKPMKDPLDVALATTLVTIPDHDVEGVVEKVKLRPPPLREEVEYDGPDVPRSAHRDSLPSLPLLSVPDTPLSLAVLPPRRASSAPPERRKRGRRRRLVPMVISTGLATAPTSQIPSPNAVFPTPLLPRERPQASMAHRAPLEPRGRDRRSKSLAGPR